MIAEIGLLLVVLLVLYFVVELGVPAALKDRKPFWLTKYVFGKGELPVGLDKQIADAKKAFENAKTALENLKGSAEQESSEAKKEYQRLHKVYTDAHAKLTALNQTKTHKRK
jgi:hypothetical protein